VVAADVTDEDVLLNVNVKDTGIGIAESATHQLFEPYSQIRNSTAHQSSGTGLGLVISKKIVETFDGTIGVESSPAQGSTFWFTMRLPRQAQADTPPRLTLEPVHGFRVLVIDDNAAFNTATSRQLTSLGVRHLTATDGVDALRFLHRDAAAGAPFSLILLDARLEGMDAQTLTNTIYHDPNLFAPKIALLTTLKDRADATQFRQKGVWMTLRKPLKLSTLHRCLFLAVHDTGDSLTSSQPGTSPPIRSEDTTLLTLPCPSRKHVRVLLVEDDRVNQRLTRHFLQRFGYDLQIVPNGREAVEAVRRQPFDLILMDCFMPELDGYDASREIRNYHSGPDAPPGRQPYIIAMTAQALPGDREKCLDAGMDDYLSKPIAPEELRLAMLRGEPSARPEVQAA
jgi:CheY-like chemotaxis protein